MYQPEGHITFLKIYYIKGLYHFPENIFFKILFYFPGIIPFGWFTLYSRGIVLRSQIMAGNSTCYEHQSCHTREGAARRSTLNSK